MTTRIVIDGNAFYEIDEECVQNRKKCRGRSVCGCEEQRADRGKRQSEHKNTGKA